MEANDGVWYVGYYSCGDNAISVNLEALDDIYEGGLISVLKLDVEGSELKVLRGASRLLSTGRIRSIVFEDHLGRSSEVIPLLASLGYEVFSIGWSVSGPKLGALSEGSLATSYEAPSYLATQVPDDALRLCRVRGWRTLRPGLSIPRESGKPSERTPECA